MRVDVSLRTLAVYLLAALFALPFSVHAQTVYGSLTGTVTDQSGGVIREAAVVIRGTENGVVRETQTDAFGNWKMPSLPPGPYRVEVAATGFEKQIRGPIAVEATVERAINTILSPGAVTQVVEVQESTPLIEATRSQLSQAVETRRILELPGLNAREGLALLMPGVIGNDQSRPGSGIVVNGARTRSNNFMIDGANNNDQSLAIPRVNVPPETLGEVRVILNNFSAEFGRNAGAIVQQYTRAGTNQFHGAARWTWRGNGLNALTTNQQRTFNAQKTAGRTDFEALRRSRGVIVRNQYVFSLGGPIVRDKLFFFTAYDGDRERRTVVPIIDALSPAAWSTLDANRAEFAPGVLDFLKASYPVANDPTSRGTVNVRLPSGATLALPLQQFNRGASGALPYGWNDHRGIARIDWNASSKDNLSFRHIVHDSNDPGIPTAIEINRVGSVIRNHNFTTNYARAWSPTLLSEARFAYAKRVAGFPENMGAQFSIGGMGSSFQLGNQNYPQSRSDNMFEYNNNWTWTRSRHALRFGGNYMLYDLNSFFAPSFRGVISYPSMQELLLDQNASFSQYAGDGLVAAKTHEFAGFFGDDWRATTSLTLNLGIRYEFTSAPYGYFSNATADKNNWAPRFGFAWSPRPTSGLLKAITGEGKMAVRGGYAITYDQVFQNVLLNVGRNYPRGVNVAITNITGQRLWNPSNQPAPPKPADYKGDPNLLPIRLFSPNKAIEQPYMQQWSFGIERQVYETWAFRAFYVGTRGLNLIREYEQNLGFFNSAIAANPSLYSGLTQGMRPVTVGGQPGVRRDPTRGSILIGDAHGKSIYHSMQLGLEKRFASGLQFQSNYTWSTFISESDDILGGQANRTLPAYPWAPALDRARSGFDQPHRWVTNYVYQLPGNDLKNPVLNRVIGGWQVSGVTTLASGTPYSVLNSANALGILPGQISTIELSQRVSYNASGAPGSATSPGVTNPMYVYNAPNSGIIGVLGANTERTGGNVTFDAALAKDVRLWGESHKLQFRWEVFNVMNRRNFILNPANTVSANTNLTQFRNLGFTDVSGRTMFLVLRYLF